jgi:hypothetical protein
MVRSSAELKVVRTSLSALPATGFVQLVEAVLRHAAEHVEIIHASVAIENLRLGN